jgi:hypothetical protein
LTIIRTAAVRSRVAHRWRRVREAKLAFRIGIDITIEAIEGAKGLQPDPILLPLDLASRV